MQVTNWRGVIPLKKQTGGRWTIGRPCTHTLNPPVTLAGHPTKPADWPTTNQPTNQPTRGLTFPLSPTLLHLRRYVESVLGINPRAYKHHISVMPPGMNTYMESGCTWAANAVVGFSNVGWSYIWVNGNLWDQQMVRE